MKTARICYFVCSRQSPESKWTSYFKPAKRPSAAAMAEAEKAATHLFSWQEFELFSSLALSTFFFLRTSAFLLRILFSVNWILAIFASPEALLAGFPLCCPLINMRLFFCTLKCEIRVQRLGQLYDEKFAFHSAHGHLCLERLDLLPA